MSDVKIQPDVNAESLQEQKSSVVIDAENPHFETEQAAQALEMVHTLLDWRERQMRQSGDLAVAVAMQAEIELRWVLGGLYHADIAHVLEALPLDDRLLVWGLVEPERDGEILLEVSDAVRESLLADMSRSEMVAAAKTLDTDEIADLADDLPREVIEEVAESLPDEERVQLRTAMSYPDDVVGSVMDYDMLTTREDYTLEMVLAQLRKMAFLPEQTDQIFVVADNDTFLGRLSLNRLLVNQPDMLVADVMRRDVFKLNPLDDMDSAAQAFERYDLVTAPVVDGQNRLVGRLTIDEVVDAIRESGEADVLAQVGLKEEQDIFSSVINAARNRAPWLLVNLCTASFASFVASRFGHTVEQIVVLAFLMSIVAGIGGNSGNQTMTLVIRALALGQITHSNVRDLIRKEFTVTGLVGVGGGIIAAVFAYWISNSVALAAVMMVSMIANMLVGASMGMLVPILRDRYGKDPAVGSSVLLTFATDTLGFLIFLGLATVFLL